MSNCMLSTFATIHSIVIARINNSKHKTHALSYADLLSHITYICTDTITSNRKIYYQACSATFGKYTSRLLEANMSEIYSDYRSRDWKEYRLYRIGHSRNSIVAMFSQLRNGWRGKTYSGSRFVFPAILARRKQVSRVGRAGSTSRAFVVAKYHKIAATMSGNANQSVVSSCRRMKVMNASSRPLRLGFSEKTTKVNCVHFSEQNRDHFGRCIISSIFRDSHDFEDASGSL